MLSIDAYRNENWEGIIEFIDYVQETDRYEGICYLQMLYRSIAGKSVPAATRQAAQEWINEDESRKELRTLLSRDYPSILKTKTLSTKAKIQRTTTKQRSKRKKKKRKKR